MQELGDLITYETFSIKAVDTRHGDIAALLDMEEILKALVSPLITMVLYTDRNYKRKLWE